MKYQVIRWVTQRLQQLLILNSGTAGEQIFESTDTSVTISVDAPIGDATVGVDDTGVLTVSGTWSGITMSSSTADVTTVGGSIAGMDVSCN